MSQWLRYVFVTVILVLDRPSVRLVLTSVCDIDLGLLKRIAKDCPCIDLTLGFSVFLSLFEPKFEPRVVFLNFQAIFKLTIWCQMTIVCGGNEANCKQ